MFFFSFYLIAKCFRPGCHCFTGRLAGRKRIGHYSPQSCLTGHQKLTPLKNTKTYALSQFKVSWGCGFSRERKSWTCPYSPNEAYKPHTTEKFRFRFSVTSSLQFELTFHTMVVANIIVSFIDNLLYLHSIPHDFISQGKIHPVST